MVVGKKHPSQSTGLGDGMFPDPFGKLCRVLGDKIAIAMLTVGTGYTGEKKDQIVAFQSWLKCYCQSGMRNLVDHNSRTIWFKVLWLCRCIVN